ncbi:aldehyde dehydrogenase family protein [Mycolicibacterium sp.]|uniref:aldehyde dehydrogenase family protein n=1 Tax=Mycolicibacterium sp. TaxID=2320850 RepID=UPI003D0ACE9C
MYEFGMTINGKSVAADESFEVVNPATGTPFAAAPDCSREQLDEAMVAAQAALGEWRCDEERRRQLLRDTAAAIAAAGPELAGVLSLEQGKPVKEAGLEFVVAEQWLRYYAELDMPREVISDPAGDGYAEVLRRPVGVVGAITPWNFPVVLAFWKIAPALRAGNTLVVKPSPFTPLTTLAFGEVLQQVLPPGVLNVVSGKDPLGAAITTHRIPRKISFTGSSATGKRVMAAAAEDLKRVTLELGGNDPAIVLDDVDAGAIADRLFWGAFGNNGQICAAIKRVYVQENVFPDVVDALAEKAKGVKVSDGNDPEAELGPVNNLPQFSRVSNLVADAVYHGARAVAGGGPLDRAGYFFSPTILTGVDDSTRIVAEEQFGPALPVLPFRTIDEVVGRANTSDYGLTASVWSADPDRAAEVGLRLDAGQVAINNHATGVQPHLPFGGHKWSGVGLENGPWGLREFTETQVIHAIDGKLRMFD